MPCYGSDLSDPRRSHDLFGPSLYIKNGFGSVRTLPRHRLSETARHSVSIGADRLFQILLRCAAELDRFRLPQPVPCIVSTAATAGGRIYSAARSQHARQARSALCAMTPAKGPCFEYVENSREVCTKKNTGTYRLPLTPQNHRLCDDVRGGSAPTQLNG